MASLIFTFEVFLVLLQVRTSLYPIWFQAVPFLVFVFFRLFLFMLAIGELQLSTPGGVAAWGLGTGRGGSWFCPR